MMKLRRIIVDKFVEGVMQRQIGIVKPESHGTPTFF